MVKMWDDLERRSLIKLLLIIYISRLALSCPTSALNKISPLDRELKTYIDNVVKRDNYNIFPGVSIRKLDNYAVNETEETNCNNKNGESVDVYFRKAMKKYADTHYVTITVPETSRFFRSK